MRDFRVTGLSPSDFVSAAAAALAAKGYDHAVRILLDGGDLIVRISMMGTTELRYLIDEDGDRFTARLGRHRVASFHAPLRLYPPNPPAKVSARVLVCHGGEDLIIRPGELEAVRKDMTKAKAELKVVTYPDAFHGFTYPGSIAVGEKYSVSFRYDAKADEASWKELTKFLAVLFGAEGADQNSAASGNNPE